MAPLWYAAWPSGAKVVMYGCTIIDSEASGPGVRVAFRLSVPVYVASLRLPLYLCVCVFVSVFVC